MKLSLQALIFPLVCLDFAVAVQLGLKGRRDGLVYPTLRRRGNLSGNSTLANEHDLKYSTNITLGGVPFSVTIDTGSSDLWVDSNVPAIDTGFNGEIKYDVGSAAGPIRTATLEFAGHTVPDQAYIYNVQPSNMSGLIGLGPSDSSVVFNTFGGSVDGTTVLDRIFLQDRSTPNFLTLLLGRSKDPTDLFPGNLTVGEILSGYEDVSNQPKLPVTIPAIAGGQHFQALLDEDGLIGPDGKVIPIQTAVNSTSNTRRATVVFDSGYTFSQLPKSAADAIYQQLPGAEFVDDIGFWIVPCDREVNVTFKFGGKSYPIHALDATIDPTQITDQASNETVKNSKGQISCIGGFQPYKLGKSQPTYDAIFGMTFLRNVYALMNFGDFIVGTKGQREDPYVQLLSTTEPVEAHSDFVKVRLNSGGNTPQGTANNSKSSNSRPRNRIIIIASISSVAGAILVVAITFFVIRSRKRAARGKYHQLPHPAPAADMRVRIQL